MPYVWLFTLQLILDFGLRLSLQLGVNAVEPSIWRMACTVDEIPDFCPYPSATVFEPILVFPDIADCYAVSTIPFLSHTFLLMNRGLLVPSLVEAVLHRMYALMTKMTGMITMRTQRRMSKCNRFDCAMLGVEW
jgi:hypothetical protein